MNYQPFIINEIHPNLSYDESHFKPRRGRTEPKYYIDKQTRKEFEVQTEFIDYSTPSTIGEPSLLSQESSSFTSSNSKRTSLTQRNSYTTHSSSPGVTNYSKASEKYKEEKAYDVDFGLLKSQEKNYLPNKISQQFESSQPIYTQVQQQQPKEGMYTQQQAFALPQTSCFPQQIQQQTYPQQQLQQACPPSQPQQLYPQQQQTLAQPQVQQVYLQQQQPLIQPQMQPQQVYPQQTCVPQTYQQPQQVYMQTPQLPAYYPGQQQQQQQYCMPQMQQQSNCFKCFKPKCNTNCMPTFQEVPNQCYQEEEFQMIKGETIYVSRDCEDEICVQGIQCQEPCMNQPMVYQLPQQACSPPMQPTCPPGCSPLIQPACPQTVVPREKICNKNIMPYIGSPARRNKCEPSGPPAPTILPTIYRTLRRPDDYDDYEEPMYRCDDRPNYDELSKEMWSDYFYDQRMQNVRENEYDYGFSEDFVNNNCGDYKSNGRVRNRKCADNVPTYSEYKGRNGAGSIESKNKILSEAAIISKNFSSQNPPLQNWPLDSKNIL